MKWDIGYIGWINILQIYWEKEYSLEYWKLILNRFGKRIFFRLLDSYFEKFWEKNILQIQVCKVYKKWKGL